MQILKKIRILRKKSNAGYIFNAAINIAIQLPQPLQGAAISAAWAAYATNVAKQEYNLWQFFIDKALWDINYLQPFGYRYIESRNVKTT